MNLIQEKTNLDIKALLSTLWLFGLLNVIFRDIHELFRPGFLAEIMTGTVNGVAMTEGLLLQAGIMLEILIVMIPLSRILPYKLNRWANIIVGVLAIAYVIGSGVNDLDDTFFAAVEVVTLAVIVWLAWKWPKSPQIGGYNE